ncbi:MAG: hemerythrin domain-containing protein [Deltaproteobacteria bacterium]|nr:hemerythrin domain-containing protein [Deltaproteobacteria bacterium]
MSIAGLTAELANQHEALRAMINACERLADELDAGRGDPAALTREVAKLRVAFDAHNAFEEYLLRPLLREVDAYGEIHISRIVAEHVGEHRAVREHLGDGPVAVLRDALDHLRVHLQAEERYFLWSDLSPSDE